MRGATLDDRLLEELEFISIHAPHARSDRTQRQWPCYGYPISIHAPHARSDNAIDALHVDDVTISIHAPHARSDAAYC